ncbi:MAG: 16S rRNA (uracil(1498)-N(3))-methyltransferase [Planctomycetes bacterium]|nr:16S rRNA (uracil(1498)-N(3))-methyltransferase [Planctomycetota bacterium]
MNLLILTEEDRLSDQLFAVSGKRRRHIINILRAAEGDTLEVGLLDGATGSGTIERFEKGKVILNCIWQGPISVAGADVELICALPRPQTLKKVLQTVATMAVSNIHIINANRVEQCYFNSSAMSGESIRDNLLEGLSQGKTTRLPKVTVNPRFRCFFEEFLPRRISAQSGESIKLVADVDADAYINSSLFVNRRRIYLAIGPEGGWVPFELEIMLQQGFIAITIGDWPLRVENAVVAALAQVKLVAQIVKQV